jgi:hypothetical protein
MSRGVGTILINGIMKLAREAKVRLRAEFALNNGTQMMYVSYKFANFHEVARHGDLIIFENDPSRIRDLPPHMKVKVLD